MTDQDELHTVARMIADSVDGNPHDYMDAAANIRDYYARGGGA